MVKFRNIALIIGINKYDKSERIANLTTARFDAIKLKEILERDYGYDVELLTDAKEHPQATCGGIRQALAKLPDRLKPLQNESNSGEKEKVRLVFYFAGHGIPSQGEDGEAGYLVAQDAELEQLKNFLPMKELHDALTELICDHVLIILDCCFAGAFKFNTRHLGFQQKPEEITKKHYERYINGAAWQVIASAAHDQKALDIALDNRVKSEDIEKLDISEKPNSPFAAALFRALDKTDQKTLGLDILHKPADYTKDGITTATELFVFLEKEMWQKIYDSNHQQVPRFWPLSKHGKGEFFFETGEFDPDRLPDTPELSQDNNPYRGLESFDEAQQRFFFGRDELVKELHAHVDQHSFIIVLGVSGSGKSSLVKAGLIPKLRESKEAPYTPWQILMPMRPGLSPLKALAKVMLVMQQENNLGEYQQLEELTEKLRSARKESPGDKDLTELLTAWLRSDPDGKLYLIVKKPELWKRLAKDEQNRIQLETLGQAALQRSSLVLEHLEDLKKDCSDEDKQKLEKFYQDCIIQIDTWSQEWRNNPEHLSHLIAQWGEQHPTYKLLLVIDQFEELTTLSQDDERKSFLQVLKSIIQTSSQQLRVVATLRADFESRFSGSEYLKDFWKLENRFFVRPMQRYEFREVIEGPAEDYVLAFEVNKKKYSLVDQLIEEVELMPGGLPLLSFTLSELYREYVQSGRGDRTLSWKDYEKLQGVTGSLTRRATYEYDELDGKQQATMRRVMLRMVVIDGGGVTRRRLPEPELIYLSSEENERVKLVIDKLILARLIVKGKESEEQPYIEPAHDFLVRGWDKLQIWIKEGAEDIALQQRLIFVARDWSKGQGGLWSKEPDRLAWLDKIIKSGDDSWLNKLESEFVEASQHKRSDELKETEEQRKLAVSRQLAAQAELMRNQQVKLLERSIILATESLRLSPSLEADQAMRKGLNLLPRRIKEINGQFDAVSFSYDGKYIAATTKEMKQIQIYDTNTGENISSINQGFNAPGISTRQASAFVPPNGKYLVTITVSSSSDEHSCLQIHEISTGGEIANISNLDIKYDPYISYNNLFKKTTFSPDGNSIATVYTDGDTQMVKLWEITTGLEIDYIPQQVKIDSISFSQNGEFLYLAAININDSSEFIIWNVKTGQNIANLTRNDEEKERIVGFSFDGRYFATTYSTIIQIWDLFNGRQIVRLSEFNQMLQAMAFSSNGQYLSTLSGSRKNFEEITNPYIIQVWDIISGIEIARILQDNYSERIFAFSSNSKYLATGTKKGIHVWAINRGDNKDAIASIPSNLSSTIAFSPDGKYLVTTDYDNAKANTENIAPVDTEEIHIWESVTGKRIASIPQNILNLRPKAIALSLDGEHIAVADGEKNGQLKVWEVKTKKLLQDSPQEERVKAIIFGLNGKYPNINIACSNNTEYTSDSWVLETQGGKRLINITERLSNFSFSSNGHYLAALGHDANAEKPKFSNLIKILDVLTGKEVACIPLANFIRIDSIALSPDGCHVAITGIEDTEEEPMCIWEVSTKKLITRITSEYHIGKVVLSQKYVALQIQDHVHIYIWQSNDLINEACNRLSRNLTLQEWQQFFPDEPYRKICPNLP
jgi:WD40 repeat protein/energy-coupling factor transporter ATP-binding protein EcfA2